MAATPEIWKSGPRTGGGGGGGGFDEGEQPIIDQYVVHRTRLGQQVVGVDGLLAVVRRHAATDAVEDWRKAVA